LPDTLKRLIASYLYPVLGNGGHSAEDYWCSLTAMFVLWLTGPFYDCFGPVPTCPGSL